MNQGLPMFGLSSPQKENHPAARGNGVEQSTTRGLAQENGPAMTDMVNSDSRKRELVVTVRALVPLICSRASLLRFM